MRVTQGKESENHYLHNNFIYKRSLSYEDINLAKFINLVA